MKKILVLLAAAFCLFVSCGKEDPIDGGGRGKDKENKDICSKMEDSKFKSFCLSYFDSNNDGKISSEEAVSVKKMDCENKGITSLKGIEYFTSLTYLNCRNNKLTSLDVSKNTKLVEFWCDYNNLTSLDVSKNTQLTVFIYNPQADSRHIIPTGWRK